MKNKNSKSVTIDELTEQIVGAKGTPERDEFEYELQMEVIGELIKKSRKERKLTQEELGKIMGVGKAQISKIENNTKDFRIGTILKTFKALNLKLKLRIEEQTGEELVTI